MSGGWAAAEVRLPGPVEITWKAGRGPESARPAISDHLLEGDSGNPAARHAGSMRMVRLVAWNKRELERLERKAKQPGRAVQAMITTPWAEARGEGEQCSC